MQELPQLKVRMFLDVQRGTGDTSAASELVHRFAHRFRTQQWPPDRPLPRLYYDPRSLELDADKRACLHAKCVVVDAEAVFISSANFTEAAQERNIEVGLLLKSCRLAGAARASLRYAFGGKPADGGGIEHVPGGHERTTRRFFSQCRDTDGALYPTDGLRFNPDEPETNDRNSRVARYVDFNSVDLSMGRHNGLCSVLTEISSWKALFGMVALRDGRAFAHIIKEDHEHVRATKENDSHFGNWTAMMTKSSLQASSSSWR